MPHPIVDLALLVVLDKVGELVCDGREGLHHEVVGKRGGARTHEQSKGALVVPAAPTDGGEDLVGEFVGRHGGLLDLHAVVDRYERYEQNCEITLQSLLRRTHMIGRLCPTGRPFSKKR